LWETISNTAGYLGLFFFGLHFMSGQIYNSLGQTLKNFLIRVAGRPWSACLSGCLVTAVVQSSSLTSVLVVGLVNAKAMSLTQAIAVIIGANLGTTMTAQLLTLNLYMLALPVIGLAAPLYILPFRRIRPAAGAITGFGLIMLGLEGMALSLSPLKDAQFMDNILTAAGLSPWQGLGGGIAASIVFQSSSVVMGLILSLAMENMISLPAAAAILIGADLGTCTTALMASLGMGRTARSAAWSHFIFNLVSLLLALIFFQSLLRLAAATSDALPRQLANFHTLYNLLGVLILLPLSSLLARLFEGSGGRSMKQL